MRYKAIIRWKELYYPNTYNFLIFLALLSFALFIFSSLLEFTIGWWNNMGIIYIPLPTPLFYPTPAQIGLGVIGVIFVLVALASFISLALITIQAFVGVKPREGHKIYCKGNSQKSRRKNNV